MAQKDSQDGTESDAEGPVAPEHPRSEGRPAGAASHPAAGAGEILSIAPADIAGEEAPPPGEPIDMPVDASAEDASAEPPPSEFVESEELALPVQAETEALPLDRTGGVEGAPVTTTHHEDRLARDEDAEAPPQLKYPEYPGPFEAPQPYEELPGPREPELVSSPTEFAEADAITTQPTAVAAPAAHEDLEHSAELPPRASVEALQPFPEAPAPSAPEPPAPATDWPRAEPAAAQTPTGTHAPPVPVSDFDRRKAEALRLLVKGARYAAYGAAGYLALVVFLIFAYRIVDPPGSTLMLFRFLGGTTIERTWVPLERISPHLVRAVIVAEDGRFCEHWGIDVEEIQNAIRRSGKGTPRGASTISMQVTKNLFLWPSKSYLRKVIELPLTLLIELVWPKWRILEIYLNVAEWGPGVFGAEAAARHHFRRSASRLGEREAALLAASLPNPVRRDAGDPGPRTSSKARVIQARMHVSGPVAGCVTGSR